MRRKIKKHAAQSEIRRLTLHGMLLVAVYWFGFCTYAAFMVTTLIDHGWSESAATGAITVMAVIIMFVQPVYGYISDKFLSEKKLSVLLLALAVVCFLSLPFSLRSGSTPLVWLSMIGITVTGAQVAGLLDAWVVGLKQEYQSINYGLIRGSGSLAYALSAQTMGMVTIALGHSARLWFGCGFIILAVFVALTFRPARRHPEDAGQADTKEKPVQSLRGAEAFRLIFSSKQYNLLLGVSFFLLLCNAAMITLIQLLIPDFDGTAAQIGTASAISAGSEVPFMFLMAYFMKKVGYKKLLVLCGMFYAIRMFITASVGTVDGLLYTQLFQGLTYAVLIPVSMSYLSRIVDERVRSTAITTYSAITWSLSSILANLTTSAFLSAGFSAQSALIFFAFSALLGFFLALYGSVRKIW